MNHTDKKTDVRRRSFQRQSAAEGSIDTSDRTGAILLAEDNLINQKVVAAIVKKAGYRITVVEDGQAAVERYTSAPDLYSLILMDIQMPKLDGISAARMIRQWEADRVESASIAENIPRRVCIIAVTAGAVYHERDDYCRAGMDDLLLKPVRGEALLTMIEAWLEKQRQAEYPG